MIKIREAILVEGRYDINALKQVVDTMILETRGFRIFKDKEQVAFLRKIAKTRGLVILTDSDGAGLVIRNYLRGALADCAVKHAYIPEQKGKERRKRRASKEGKLGVEGMRPQILLDTLQRAGVQCQQEQTRRPASTPVVTKADLYAWGLTGGEDSAQRRRTVLQQLALPSYLSTNALLEVINMAQLRSEIEAILTKNQEITGGKPCQTQKN